MEAIERTKTSGDSVGGETKKERLASTSKKHQRRNFSGLTGRPFSFRVGKFTIRKAPMIYAESIQKSIDFVETTPAACNLNLLARGVFLRCGWKAGVNCER